MLILKRKESFCASHRLFNPQWSDEKNFQVYGKCAHKNGHGHNYQLEVCLTGHINPDSGMIFNLIDLKKMIDSEVLSDVDHKHLNFDVPWLQNKIPTTEVLVEEIWLRLQNKLANLSAEVFLHEITVWETEKNSVTKKGN